MRARRLLGGLAALALLAPASVTPARAGTVYAIVSATSVVLGNGAVERVWTRAGLASSLTDKRTGAQTVPASDFAVSLSAGSLESTAFTVTSAAVESIDRGLRVRMQLETPGGALKAERTAEVYEGIAGFRTQTSLTSAAPMAITGGRLESVGVGPQAAASLHSFRAGADWREPGWSGPPMSLGDPHAGSWRQTTTGGTGQSVRAAAQYASAADALGRTAFIELERNDLPSSTAAFDGTRLSVAVDLTRDVISLGPLEESGHAENPTAAPAGRVRAVKPGTPFAFEPTFVGFGRNADDEAWQFHAYLDRQAGPYDRDATFNSNGTDHGRISTGAKDDMDMAEVRAAAAKAKRLGVATFILDDGWQAASGDWQPDSAAYPEPRGLYPPRFPDAEFAAVREAIAPMKLGLWMSPTFFNPASSAVKQHPEWVCQPIGAGLVAANVADPGGGSNEAGLGPWGPNALDYVKGRIDHAIDHWGVSYFKFDFLLWLDCAGQGDLYDFHDRFTAMLDSLRAAHPGVTFEIDETNDYRLFPFESVSRGPSWFQNGSPSPSRLLHNIWTLSPWVPASSLGQHFLGDYRGTDPAAVDLRMAAALLSHPTFFSDLSGYDDAVLDRASAWLAFRRAHLADFTGVVYPLLDDPLANGWTALQSWNPETATGALLAFRQDAGAATASVALRNVPPGRTFTLRSAPSGDVVGTATSEQLAAGLPVTIAQPGGQQVLLLAPSG
ncbi:MAG TPA: alpha-galactosidase [Acidimicrobiales bacterium]|nr:alpha-galactosidase [Acidimicrobiales bacterium]